ELGDLTKAKLNIDNLQDVIDEQEEAAGAKKPWQIWKKGDDSIEAQKAKKSKKKKKSKSSKKKKEEEKKPEFPKKAKAEFYKVKGQLYIAKKDYEEAIK